MRMKSLLKKLIKMQGGEILVYHNGQVQKKYLTNKQMNKVFRAMGYSHILKTTEIAHIGITIKAKGE